MNTGPVCCPETSVENYHYLLRNDPEERSSYVFVNYIVRVHINIGVSYIWSWQLEQGANLLQHGEAEAAISEKCNGVCPL